MPPTPEHRKHLQPYSPLPRGPRFSVVLFRSSSMRAFGRNRGPLWEVLVPRRPKSGPLLLSWQLLGPPPPSPGCWTRGVAPIWPVWSNSICDPGLSEPTPTDVSAFCVFSSSKKVWKNWFRPDAQSIYKTPAVFIFLGGARALRWANRLGFGCVLGSILEYILRPFSCPNFGAFLDPSRVALGHLDGPIWEPFWTKKGSRNDTKSWPGAGCLRGDGPGLKMDRHVPRATLKVSKFLWFLYVFCTGHLFGDGRRGRTKRAAKGTKIEPKWAPKRGAEGQKKRPERKVRIGCGPGHPRDRSGSSRASLLGHFEGPISGCFRRGFL